MKIRARNILGCGLAVACLVVAACAVDEVKKESFWRPYSQSDDYQFFYDEKSMEQRNGGIVRLTLKRMPKAEDSIINETKKGIIREMKKRQNAGMSIRGYENWNHELVICEVNCGENLILFLQSVNYDDKGTILDTLIIPKPVLKWEKIIPGTINDSLRKSVCNS